MKRLRRSAGMALALALAANAAARRARDAIDVPLFARRRQAPEPFDVRRLDGHARRRARRCRADLLLRRRRLLERPVSGGGRRVHRQRRSSTRSTPRRERLGTLDGAHRRRALGGATTSRSPGRRSEAAPGRARRRARAATRRTSRGEPSATARSCAFVADLDLVPLLRGTHAVQGVRDARRRSSTALRCELRLDARRGGAQVDFDAARRARARRRGVIRIASGSRAYEALIVAMTSSAPPRFRVVATPTEGRPEMENADERSLVSGLACWPRAERTTGGGSGDLALSIAPRSDHPYGLDPGSELDDIQDGWSVRYEQAC